MKHKTSRATFVKPRTSAPPLVEGLARPNIQVSMKGKYRNWKSMSYDEIVEYAKAYCKEKGITKISELQIGPKKDRSLYTQLRTRALIDKVFERKKEEKVVLGGRTFRIPLNAEGKRHWKKVSDKKMLKFAKAYCKEKEITKPSELVSGSKKDSGLYAQLSRRNIIDEVFGRTKIEKISLGEKTFEIPMKGRYRNWAVMTSSALVDFTKAYCVTYKITNRHELEKIDSGLYQVLRNRNLLDNVFSSIRADQEVKQLATLADALESFGGSEK